MDIGTKIKELRTAKCMTQSQLAGDYMTRNMLSRIENGAVKPSLSTTVYISERLKVPVGYLLTEGDDELIYKKIYYMDNIKRAFKDENYKICRDLCLATKCNDDEICFILSRCNAGIAKEEFFFGRLRSAVRFFEEAIEYDAKTFYSDGFIKSEAAVYMKFLHRISPMLLIDATDIDEYDIMVPNDYMCRYMMALEKLDSENDSIIKHMLESYCSSQETPLSVHIQARYAMKHSDYQAAQTLLKRILNMQERIADPILYSVFWDLEVCSREMGDFKGAYEYSADKVNLLERMLAEVEDI